MTLTFALLAAALWLLGMIPTAMAGRAEGAPLRHPRSAAMIVFWPVAVVYAVAKLLVEELA